MSDKTPNEFDESAALSENSSSGEFIDDYSHLRLSYYQYRDHLSLDVSETSFQDSAYSTNASTNETFDKHIEFDDALIDESLSENKDNTKSDTNPKPSKEVLYEEERRKLREYLVSQIPDFPHPSYTAASIIASASHRMNPANHFVYNNRIEQGIKGDEDIDMTTFTPQRRSTLKPDTK